MHFQRSLLGGLPAALLVIGACAGSPESVGSDPQIQQAQEHGQAPLAGQPPAGVAIETPKGQPPQELTKQQQQQVQSTQGQEKQGDQGVNEQLFLRRLWGWGWGYYGNNWAWNWGYYPYYYYTYYPYYYYPYYYYYY
jgi:hypothetical protein